MQRRHVFLSPGTYDLGGGRTWEFTSGELKRIVSNTLDLQAKGFRVPVFVGHRPVGDAAGGPMISEQGEEDPAAAPRIGWLADLWQNDDGGLEYELDLDEPNAELPEDLPEFTSPEIRRGLTLPDGSTIGPVIAHVALTDRPRNPNQQPLDEVPEAVQFSLADLITPVVTNMDQPRDELTRRILRSKVLGPALRGRLAELAGIVQFSAEGEAEPSLTLSETLTLLEETLPESPPAEETLRREHPGGDDFFEGHVEGKGERLSAAQAAKIANGQLSRAGMLATRQSA